MKFGKRISDGRESGQALLELALTLPLFVLILLGGAELARLAYAAIEVTNAAKAAVQYGDQNVGTATDVAGMTNAAINDAANMPNAGTLALTASSTYQCSNAPDINITVTNTSCPGAQIVQTLSVTTSIAFDPLIHLPGLPSTYTLHGHATQKVLGS